MIVTFLKGKLPVVVEFSRYDRSPGTHNITIIANSTLGVVDDYTYEFYVKGILVILIIVYITAKYLAISCL